MPNLSPNRKSPLHHLTHQPWIYRISGYDAIYMSILEQLPGKAKKEDPNGSQQPDIFRTSRMV